MNLNMIYQPKMNIVDNTVIILFQILIKNVFEFNLTYPKPGILKIIY